MPSSSRAGLDQRLLQRLRALDLPPNAKVAVGFSGGNDSLALALALSRCAAVERVSPFLIHIDHQLRPGSGDDAAQCIGLASVLDVPLVIERLEPGIEDRSGGLGIEEQARRKRYTALARVCAEQDAAVLATGHHLDDQAETVLMHLLRGSGLHGAAGMRELTQRTVPWWTEQEPGESETRAVTVWRPLLTERRKTLEEYLASSSLLPVIDETNADISYRRNAIRHEILTTVEREWPGAVEALGRFAASAAVDDAYLRLLSEPLAERAISESGGLRIDEVNASDPALASRVVISWLQRSGIEHPTQERIEGLLAFAGSAPEQSRFEAGNGRGVVRFGNELRIGALAELMHNALTTVPGPFHDSAADIPPAKCSGEEQSCSVSTGAWTIWYALHRTTNSQLAVHGRSHTIPFDEMVSLQDIVVRTVQHGDCWLNGDGEVRDSLRRAGVHPMARQAVVCLAIGGKVLFIPDVSRPAKWNDPERTTTAWLTIAWETARHPT